MVEMRWLVDESEQKKLQYRVFLGTMDASGALNIAAAEFGPWLDVPTIWEEDLKNAPQSSN